MTNIYDDNARRKFISEFIDNTIEYLKQTPPEKVNWENLLFALEFVFGDGSTPEPLGCISHGNNDKR